MGQSCELSRRYKLARVKLSGLCTSMHLHPRKSVRSNLPKNKKKKHPPKSVRPNLPKKKKGKILHLKVIFGCTIGPKIRFLLENKVAGMAIHLVQHVECLAKV